MLSMCWVVVCLLTVSYTSAVQYRPHGKFPMKNTTLKWKAKARLEGPNMCAKETIWEYTPKTFDVAWTGGSSCAQSTIRIECCEGWMTVPGERGCPYASPLPSAESAATRVNAGCWFKFLQSAGLRPILDDSTNTVTVFAPVDAVAGIYCNGVGVGPYGTASHPHNFLSYVVRGRYRSESMQNDQILASETTSYQTIRINVYPNGLITANCIPLLSRDVTSDGPLIHTLSAVLPQYYKYAIPDMLVRPEPREIWDGEFYSLLLEQADLKPLLDSPGPFTVFVPTDAAMRGVDSQYMHALRSDQAAFKAFVLNHVLDGVHCSSMLQDALLTSHQGENSRASCRRTKGTFVRDAKIVAADYMASNGVIHVVDHILLPRRAMLLLDLLRNVGLTSFAALIEKAGLRAMFTSSTTYTVFAPSNSALDDSSTVNATESGIFVLNHVISGRILTSSFRYNKRISSRGNRVPLTVRTLRDKILLDAAVVTSSDIEGLNAVVHIIDRPMSLPSRKSIVQWLKDDGGYTQFLYALQTMQPSLYIRLDTASHEEFTLFAVPDSYLTNRFYLYYDSRVLLHHILGQALVSEQVPANGRLTSPTTNNLQLTLVRRGVHFFAGSTQILLRDIICSNGVIQITRDVIVDPRQY